MTRNNRFPMPFLMPAEHFGARAVSTSKLPPEAA